MDRVTVIFLIYTAGMLAVSLGAYRLGVTDERLRMWREMRNRRR